MRDPELQALIEYRLDEAHEALTDAGLLLGAGRYRAAANRLYYAAFYAALAALLSRHLEYSKHSAVIAFFNKEFIRTGVLPKDLGARMSADQLLTGLTVQDRPIP